MPKIEETYRKLYENEAQFNAGTILAFEDRTNALKNSNLPHNQLLIADNQGSATGATLFIYLDEIIDQDTPDYIVFPNQQMTVKWDEGVKFSRVFVKNTHAGDNIAANTIKIRVSTVKEV